MLQFVSRILGIALCLVSLTSQAAATQSLTRFFDQVKTYSASFDQTVLDEAHNPLQESSGVLYLERPGKFRWDYDLPFKQKIIGDGKKVWVYDVELKQVTVRNMTGALGQTPAILLAGRGSLQANFHIKDLGKQGKLEWVQMLPKSNDGGFEDIRIGFENGSIRSLELIDGFGHTTRITLRDPQENKKIDAGRFNFTPPEGVDVLSE